MAPLRSPTKNARVIARRQPAAEALDEWCFIEHGRAEALARTCGVSASSVSAWRRGISRPALSHRETIATITGGAVAAAAWASRDARTRP